ncbi:MAG: hypothetical protein QW728_01835 [Thermoplasmata archaeon]
MKLRMYFLIPLILAAVLLTTIWIIYYEERKNLYEGKEAVVLHEVKMPSSETSAKSRLNSHTPIRIDCDSDFTSENGLCTGSGTESDPYIIENWYIEGLGYGYGIYIGNTTGYFVVRNCTISQSYGNSSIYYWNSGIALFNVSNAGWNTTTFPAVTGDLLSTLQLTLQFPVTLFAATIVDSILTLQ